MLSQVLMQQILLYTKGLGKFFSLPSPIKKIDRYILETVGYQKRSHGEPNHGSDVWTHVLCLWIRKLNLPIH